VSYDFLTAKNLKSCIFWVDAVLSCINVLNSSYR